MIEIIVLSIVLFYFIISSYEDIKKREVYDYFTYSFLLIIFSISIFYSYFSGSINPFIYSSIGMFFGFLLGYLLFYIGVWGGGDAKFMIGFGGSSYYLLSLSSSIQENFLVSDIYEFIFLSLQPYFLIFQTIFASFFLIIFVSLFLFYLIRSKQERKSIFKLQLIFLFLFVSILSSSLYLSILLILISLGIIFFASNDIFLAGYRLKNISPENLKIGMILEQDINLQKVKISRDTYLSQDLIELIRDSELSSIQIKKFLPLSLLIMIYLVTYFFILILSNLIALHITSFLILFLLYSFIVGGILSIGLILYFFIVNFSKLDFSFSLIEKIFFIFILLLNIVLYIYSFQLFLLSLFLYLYYFLKIAKTVEKVMFISRKQISQIVPGDWIVEDVKIGNKVYYNKEDFKLGVEEHQLKKIKELSVKNKSFNTLLVKDGIAFIPPMFIGFILLILI